MRSQERQGRDGRISLIRGWRSRRQPKSNEKDEEQIKQQKINYLRIGFINEQNL